MAKVSDEGRLEEQGRRARRRSRAPRRHPTDPQTSDPQARDPHEVTDPRQATVPSEATAPPEATVPVPAPSPVGDDRLGSGRRERRRRRDVRRRWIVTVPTLLLVLVLLAVLGARLRGDHSARPGTRSGSASAPVAHDAPTLLLAHVGAGGRVDLAVVVGVGGHGTDGSVLLVPTLTQVETPSFDPQLIADLRNLGSTSLLHTTVENLLGVRIDRTALVDDSQLAEALAPAGTLSVDLRDPVALQQGDKPVSFGQGTQPVNPFQATLLLTARGATDEIDHLVTVQAVFEGWLRALRSPQVAAATSARLPALATLVAAANATTDFATVPVDAISSGAGERYQVRADALLPAMQQAFPDQLLGVGGQRPRVELLNGTGVVGLVQKVSAVVVPAGANVVKTDNFPGFGQAVTRVVYYRDAQRPAAQRLLRALGAGQLAKEPNDIGVFDVTIIVGADFHAPAGS